MADFPIKTPVDSLPPPPPDDPLGRSTPRTHDWVHLPVEDNERPVDTGLKSSWNLWLLRRTWLLVHGEDGLTPIAHKNLATAACLLSTLWLVDILAWLGLANLLLNGSLRALTPWTGLALLLGVLMATSILFYESTFLTTDFLQSRSPAVSISVRVLLICAIAVATSVPLDMFLLEGQINRRIHQEQVLQQVPALIRHWIQAERMIDGTPQTQAEQDARTVEPRSALADATRDRVQQEGQRRVAQAQIDTQQRQIAEIEKSLTQASGLEVERLRQQIMSLRAALSSLQAQERRAATAVGLARDRERRADVALEIEKARIHADRVREGTTEAARFETWIHDLLNALPLTTVTERRGATADRLIYDGLTIETVDLGQRLIALTDVLQGAPPRRPGFSTEDLTALGAMNLLTIVKGDANETPRLMSEAGALRRVVWISFVGFAFLPFMILALKFLFDRDTETYLKSRQHPRQAPPTVLEAGPGNPAVRLRA